MQRYFLELDAFVDEKIQITGADFHHITRVMRMGTTDQLIAVKPDGQAALAEIADVTSEAIQATVIEWLKEDKELPIKLAIASGLPKGDKLEVIVQKGTEMGAHEFIPFIAARSVVKWDEKKAGKKIERLQKIAKEAAEQSHRTVLPHVTEPLNLAGLINHASEYDVKMVAFEESAKQGEKGALVSALQEMKPGQSLLFVFGPEGGLSEGEIAKLTEAGFTLCGLGPRILRTETAPLYTLAAVSYQLELLR
ncbi:16S rRNA (uracil(1498)-N(3))-methyltransferase [Peribacillus sp. JNUCC 23]|uniref:16S rRNA (uracil(1498)-N(3))-methyltransferase n=1 Tax=Peribacillus sp. NPDC096379 TaxID=3364393 RepID=UPI0038297010